jgi:hypothetical protein
MKRFEEMKNKVPEVMPKLADTIQYSNTMGSQPTAYAMLLKSCQKHGADKSMYDEITAWAQHHHSKDPNVFRVANRSQRWTHKKLLCFLKQQFQLNGLEPQMHDVSLHDDRNVTVPVVDFPESMHSILNDPGVMKHIMKELEKSTWRPVTLTEEHESNEDAVINDKTSGWLYIDLHCPAADTYQPHQSPSFSSYHAY